MSTSSTTSPFRTRKEDFGELERNEEFRSIRQRLERTELEKSSLSFCAFHQHSCCAQELSTFRLHRDIIHALFVPLFQIHKHASQIASCMLSNRKAAEPELAFRGDARSAYSWLHCILTEEHDWCSTQGCSACVVLHVLHSEPTIRIVAAACLLSDHLQETKLVDLKRSLPVFNFWLGAVETAVREDPFWGDAFWPDIEYRAYALEGGIKQLILQCLELRGHQETQKVDPQCLYATGSVAIRETCRYDVRTIALQTSSLARSQLRMTREEQEWLSKIVAACWRSMCRNEDRMKTLELPHHAPQLSPIPRKRSLSS